MVRRDEQDGIPAGEAMTADSRPDTGQQAPTPRTDALVSPLEGWGSLYDATHDWNMLLKHARQLELELAAERRQYAQCSEALNRALARPSLVTTDTPWVRYTIPCANAEEAKAELAKMVDNTDASAGYDLHCVGYDTPDRVLMVAVSGCGPKSAAHADYIASTPPSPQAPRKLESEVTAEECFASCNDYSCVRADHCMGGAGHRARLSHIEPTEQQWRDWIARGEDSVMSTLAPSATRPKFVEEARIAYEAHSHRASPHDIDQCADCGHNFRDPVHLRVGESKHDRMMAFKGATDDSNVVQRNTKGD